MKRNEALALIDQPVRVWTSANGVYTGILRSVTGSPWRGKVMITGVLEVAQHFERGQACRRGFRPGEEIEVGGASIRVLHGDDLCSKAYLDVLLEQAGAWKAQVVRGPNAWFPATMVEALEKVIEAERRRLVGGEWRIAS